MSLRDEIKPITGNKRKYILLRIADMDTDTALKLCGIVRGTYNTWCQQEEFISLHRRVKELSSDYKQEAIQLLRRDNQMSAVLLEAKVVAKMRDELESGEYILIRTNLAREVYSKLVSELDVQPKVQNLTWQQRVQQLFTGNNPRLEEGIVDGVYIEAGNQQEIQSSQSQSVQKSEQTDNQIEETDEET